MSDTTIIMRTLGCARKQDLARLLGVTPSTVSQWDKRGLPKWVPLKVEQLVNRNNAPSERPSGQETAA